MYFHQVMKHSLWKKKKKSSENSLRLYFFFFYFIIRFEYKIIINGIWCNIFFFYFCCSTPHLAGIICVCNVTLLQPIIIFCILCVYCTGERIASPPLPIPFLICVSTDRLLLLLLFPP